MVTMTQEYNNTKKQKRGRLYSAFSLISLSLMIFGILSCIVFLSAGVIGVIRGYSVQLPFSRWFVGIVMVCSYYELFPSQRGRRGGIYGTIATFFIVMALCYIGLSMLQGRHRKRGDEYYEQGNYHQAIEEFKKETETWYLHLKYNIDEEPAMNMLAKSYYKVGDFDNARKTYKMMVDRYAGYFSEEAKKYLEKGLEPG